MGTSRVSPIFVFCLDGLTRCPEDSSAQLEMEADERVSAFLGLSAPSETLGRRGWGAATLRPPLNPFFHSSACLICVSTRV